MSAFSVRCPSPSGSSCSLESSIWYVFLFVAHGVVAYRWDEKLRKLTSNYLVFRLIARRWYPLKFSKKCFTLCSSFKGRNLKKYLHSGPKRAVLHIMRLQWDTIQVFVIYAHVRPSIHGSMAENLVPIIVSADSSRICC